MSDVDTIKRECARKKRYGSERQARAIVHKRRQDGAPPLRVYVCPHCGGWHITHRVESKP